MKISVKNFGFSLVEIVIALGVASFTLAAIIGLAATSFMNGKAAADDTAIALMAAKIFSQLNSQPFSDAYAAAENTTWYFQNEGRELKPPGGGFFASPPSDAVFKCTSFRVADARTESSNGDANLIYVGLKFEWPASANPPAHTKVIHASLSKR